jgi:hypothetical protein
MSSDDGYKEAAHMSRPGGGLLGGQSTHFLLPEMTAFQADVELGSCSDESQRPSHTMSQFTTACKD